jgi:hypothetical protein
MKKLQPALCNVLKLGIFLALAVGILYAANFLLKLKSIDGCYVAQMFERQKPDTVDVVFVGSSHIYTDVNPAVLWEEYGIASYDFAGSNQPLWNSYYYMKEAIEKQHPDLVVIDMYRAIENVDVIDDARIAMNTLGLADGANKRDSIYASVADEEEALDYILSYPIYHTRYEALSENDFKRYNGDTNGENYKGFNTNCISMTPFEGFSDFSSVEDTLEMTQKNEEYLNKIIALAKETDTELILMVAPYQGIMPSDKMIYNRVRQIAKENGVEFVDFNEYYTQIGLDPMRDCAESSHLNYYGSEKFSAYLGSYIKKRYDIEDHRGEEPYISWDRNAEHYEEVAYNFRLRNTADIGEYLNLLLANDAYTVCISLDGVYDYGGLDVKELFASHGFAVDTGAVMVLDQGELVFYADDAAFEDYDFHMDIGTKTLVINGNVVENRNAVTGESTETMSKTVNLGKIGCKTVEHGVNIVVYDHYTESFLDSFGFDATQQYQKARY